MARPEDLTIDFKKLLRMTVRDRVQMAQSREGPSYLAALTPTQYAMLFPEYYRKDLPDIGLTAATSGATPLGTVSGEGPSDGKMPTAVPTAPSREPPTTGGKEVAPSKSSVAKESWQQRLMREAEERRSGKSTKGQLSGIKISDKVIAKSRERFAKELEDPETRKKLFTLMRAEVGGYSREARTAFLEKVMNRSMIQDVSLRDTIENRVTGTGKVSNKPLRKGYFKPLNPGGTIATGKITGISESQSEEYQSILSEVLGGTNITNGGTHNVSGDWGKRHIKDVGGTNVQTFGKTDRFEGEMIYNKPGEYNKVQSYWNQIKEEIGIEEATKVLPPTTDDTGKVIPEQTPGRMAPVADVTPVPMVTLPENIEPKVKEYYDSLTDDKKTEFMKNVNELGIDRVNQIAREHASAIIAETAKGKRSPNQKVVDAALEMRGLHEVKDRETIKKFLDKRKSSSVDPKEAAWCSSFVNAALEDSGIRGTGSAAAGTWHNWGEKVSRPEDVQAGDVLVNYRRSKRTKMIGSHVVIATGPAYKDKKGNWIVPTVGGNQSLEGDPEKETSYVSESTRRFDEWAVRRAAESDYYEPPPIEPVPEEATAVTTPQTAPPSTEPPAAGTTGSPTPYTPDYKGGLQPNVKPATEPTKTGTPPPTASPVNPTATKAATDAMAQNKVGPDHPDFKDYRDNPTVKAEAAAKAPVSTETPSVEFDPIEVKQDEKPKEMKYGGSKQSPSGEPFVAVDTETGDHMFTFDKGEKVNFEKDGRIKVTPNTRRDSEEIEGLAKSRQDYMNNDARDRMIATSTQANQQATTPSSPVNNPNLQQMYSQMAQESMSTYKTPSAARAFKESRFQGRGDDPFALAPANVKT